MIRTILGWLTGGTLDRVLDTIDSKFDNETERERIRAEVVTEYARTQAQMLNGNRFWFWLLLIFIAPLGFWWAAVCVYSVLWCAGCAFPQSWSIAALPAPLDEWGAAIVGSLFAGKFIQEAVNRWRR